MPRHYLRVVPRSKPPSNDKIALAMAVQSRQGALDLLSPTSKEILATAALQAENLKKLNDPRVKKMQAHHVCESLKAALRISWADREKRRLS